MKFLLLVLAIVVGLPGALAALHLTTLSIASLFYREPRPGTVSHLRFLVVVPARNEEEVLPATLAALTECIRPDDLVLVVADRCTDRTASIAHQHGALVLERRDGDIPGRAAALNDGLLYAASLDWDAVVFVDADSVVDVGFFEACERVLATGAMVAQARAEAQPRPGALGHVAVAASAIGGVAVPRGRDRVGGWVRLKGSGMVLQRQIAEQHTFKALGASEDGHLSLELCLDGVRHRHIDSARLRFATAGTVKDATAQKVRYEGGRLNTARRYLPRLLRARGIAPLDAAVHLCSPPLSIAVVLLAVSALLAWLAGWPGLAFAGAMLIALLAIDEAIALLESRTGARSWLAFLLAPPYLLWKIGIQIVALVRPRAADRPYEPTPRT